MQRERQHFILRQGAPVPNLLFQMAAGNEFHRDIESPERPAGRQHPHDVRMADRRRDPRFFFERRDPPFVGRKVFVEDFQRHLAVERVVVSDEHHAHPADRVFP
jgi:hypothetical protein